MMSTICTLVLAAFMMAGPATPEPPPPKTPWQPAVPADPDAAAPGSDAQLAPPEAPPDKPKPDPVPMPQVTLDDLLEKMEEARKQLMESEHKTFAAEVVKTRRIVVLDETEEFVGTLRFKFPRLLRLELAAGEGEKSTVYIVGEKYGWSYDVEANQAVKGQLREMGKKAETANPLEYGLASSLLNLEKSYNRQLRAPEKVGEYDTVPLELIPKGGPTYELSRIVFWIDRATWLPVQIREYKSNDEIVETHTFSNIRIDTEIDDDVFELDERGIEITWWGEE